MSTRRERRERARKIKRRICLALGLAAVICLAMVLIPRLSADPQAMATPIDQAAETPEVTPQAQEGPSLEVTPGPGEGEGQDTEAAQGDAEETEPAADDQGEAEDTEKEEQTEPAPAQPEPAPVPKPLEGLIIGIDPGHQDHPNYEKEAVAPGSSEMKMKVSGGTAGVSTRIPEYVVVLDVGMQLKARLEALGAQVVMTRESHDVDISNQERAKICNDAGCHLVLRLHCNGAEDKSVNGISLFIRATGEGAEEAFEAAKALLPAMLEETGARDFRIHKSDTYTGLNWSVPPSILVEMGFMSNPEEDQKLCDPGYQALLVEGMVKGIAQYFERDLTGADPSEAEETVDVPPLDTENYVE